jgi:hypothetical protein
LIDSSPTEMNEPHPNGFLFKGEAEDKIRAGGDCDLSLATQFGERYEVYTRRESIPKMFTNLRSTCVTELVKIFGFDKHSVCRWIGHAEYIQDEHYLQMMDDDHAAAMSNLSTGKINPQINPSGTGSYLSEMVFIALHRNLPELVEAATEHALGITKIGKNKMFGTPAVRATPVWSPPRELVESSGGGTKGSGGLTRKTKRFPFPEFSSTPLSTPDTNGVSFVPFVLAQLWTDLGRVEQTMVEQIIREYLRSREVNDGG